MYYAIYDLKTGKVLQTHVEVDAQGKRKKLSESQVLAMLHPHIQKDTVGVAELDQKPQSGKPFQIDPQTGKLKQD